MTSSEIMDIKDFMARLLIQDNFDFFLLTEATVTTFNTFYIDGHLCPDFFDTDIQEQLQQNKIQYSSWSEIRPFVYSVIKGKRTPLNFKIVFQFPSDRVTQFIEANQLSYRREDISGLYLNILFDQKKLTCTTGTSLRTFSLDKSLEQAWDRYGQMLLKNMGITVSEI